MGFKIAIDIEGTLADIHTPWVKLYNLKNNSNLTVEDITKWEFSIGEKFGMQRGDFFIDVVKLWEEKWKEILPTEENIVNKIEKLAERNDVQIVTNSVAKDVHIKNWLGLHSIDIQKFPFKQIPVHTSKTSLGFDIYVDDNPQLVKDIESKKFFLFLYDRPWNRHVKDSEFVKRIKNFDQILTHPKLNF